MTTNFERNFENLKIPEVEMKKHQQELRRVLLASSHWDRKPSLVSTLMVFLKGGEKNMNYKRLGLSALVIAIVMVGVFAMTSKSGGSTVYAQEIAQKSMQTVSQLSPEAKQEKHLPADSEILLKEAKSTQSLQVLTYDQVKDTLQTNPSTPGVVTQREEKVITEGTSSGKGFERLKQAKFLQYTRSNGEKVLIGIDQDNIPFFTSVKS